MKKIYALLLVICCVGFVQAQNISENAIGLRLGDSDGLGAEISYQRALGDNNRLEVDFGWRDNKDYSAIKLTGLYQWVWQLDGNFNWYAGAGGGFASYSLDKDKFDDDFDNSQTALFVAGDIGIEYNFDIPLIVSLDFRPEIGLGNFNNDLDFDIAFGIRYQF
jgi:hypothetical protein